MKAPRRIALRLAALASLLAALLYGPAVAAAAEAGNPGKTLYLQYCSSCHGSGGQGDGVVSGFLRPRPTDLTRLTKKPGGEFPFVETMQQIDGTKTVRAHGDPTMPVWGESFQQELAGTPDGQERVRGKLMLITEYIRSIQAK
jgi:mono/diheme cytochrome c family protein